MSQYMRGAGGGLKSLLKNTSEGAYLSVKLPAISLQACKCTKSKIPHIFFKDLAGLLSHKTDFLQKYLMKTTTC